jgi:gamma-glutamylcysteine synthetase
VDEGRKRVLLIAASILAARKLGNWDGRPSPALESAIADAITIAERIMARIDSRWPVKASTGLTG